MIVKTYAYLGKNTASICIPVSDGGSLCVEFKGGNIFSNTAYSLAKSKPIVDPVIQDVIENSEYFNKSIILVESREALDPGTPIPMKDYPDVTNFAEACTVLKQEYQAKASQLKAPSMARAYAESVHVSFSNWK